MTRIGRYITGEIFKYLAILTLLIVGLYLVVDFFEKIDNFMEKDLPLWLALEYLLLNMPLVIAQISPVSLFLSVIVVFGVMNKNNEILALRSGGISVYMLLKPVFAVGLAVSILLFFFSEVIVPITAARANRIWLQHVKGNSAVVSKEKNIWIRGDRSIIHIKYFNPVSEMVYGVTLHYFDDKFTLTRRVDARMGVYRDGKWILVDAMEQVLNPKTGEYHAAFSKRKEAVFNFAPEELGRVAKKSEEMNFTELRQYIQRIENEGYDASVYKVDLHAKLAFPFVCIVLCFAGAGISLRFKTRDRIGGGVAFGVGAAFLYWTFYSFCLSLGYGEMLPPFVAAWTANAAFICFAAITLLNAD